MITESDALAHALDMAANLWPEYQDERAELLRRIIDRGVETVEAEIANKETRRKAAIQEASGSLSGLWPTNWREEFRAEWPE